MEKLKQIRVVLTSQQYQRLGIMAEYHHNSITEEVRSLIRDAWWSYFYETDDLPFPDASIDPFSVDDHYPDE